MEEIKQFIDGIQQIAQSYGSYTPGIKFSIIGLIFTIIAAILAYRAVKTENALPGWYSPILLICIIAAVLFSVAGPGLTILESQQKIPTVSRDEALNRLKTNERVKWVIRLIAYDPAKKEGLEIGEFPRIGPKEQRFSFVGNYEEVRGYPVSDAVRMMGGIMGPERHVSAVIFELVGNLYPANARGLLQAISKTENYRLTKNTSLDVAFNVLSQINPEEKTNLEDETIHSYGWDDYEQYYEHFCRLAQNFRRGEYTVKTFMGDVNKDWNPLGFSRIDTETTRPTVSDKECEIKKWSSAVSNYKTVFGARTFLIRNYEIISIKNRYLIDFEDPDHQFIPDIWNDRRH